MFRMKAFALTVVLLSSTCTLAQKSIQGTWKIIAIAGEGLYLDFKNDSIAYSNPDDSTTLRQIVPLLAAHFGNHELVFGDKGFFEARNNNKVEETGNYSVDQKNKIITNVVIRNGMTVKEKMRFEFLGPDLQLTYLDDEGELVVILERVK